MFDRVKRSEKPAARHRAKASTKSRASLHGGHEVFFAEDEYNPVSREGQGILAHELTHVGQQTGFQGGPAAQRIAAAQRVRD